jgi:hypothetical protein
MLTMLCRKNPRLPAGTGFYRITNTTSTLRAHITHEGGEHYKYYCEQCEKNNITVVVKSPDMKEGNSSSNHSRQSNVSSFMVKQSPVPAWHQKGLISHLCEWIILDDQVCILCIIAHPMYLIKVSAILCCREELIQGPPLLSVPNHSLS